MKALPWLLGSLGTIAEDAIIFVQFQLYSKNSKGSESPIEEVEEDGDVPPAYAA